jgi:hypothetical protein
MDDSSYSTPISQLNDIHIDTEIPMQPSFHEPNPDIRKKAEKLNEQLNNLYHQEISNLQDILESSQTVPKNIEPKIIPNIQSSIPSNKNDILKKLLNLEDKNEYILIAFICLVIFSSRFDFILKKIPQFQQVHSLLIKTLIVVILYHIIKKTIF